jgi:hypothetical protein
MINSDIRPSGVYVISPVGLSPNGSCTDLLSVSTSTHVTKRQLPMIESAACDLEQYAPVTMSSAIKQLRPIEIIRISIVCPKCHLSDPHRVK